jgi:two-component system sensor histidine kinase/response regulator
LRRDAAGNPQYLIGLTEDITEREGAQESLQESENPFRSIFENAQIGLSISQRAVVRHLGAQQ